MDILNKKNWLSATISITAIFIAIISILWSTSYSFYDVWTQSETYTHGFIILPISIWLIWQNRNELSKVSPQPNFSILILFILSSFLWLLAYKIGVQVIEQFSLVAMLITATMSVLGWRLSLYLAFPLLFLFFAVPLGEDLVPPMMEFTATFTVKAIELTGIPVYRNGLWFSLPSGNWSVVEACSGVRYIIASITLGFLYAYVSYHTFWKRMAFIIFSAILPIIANGVRAYIIVMIGHLSDMELATGVDHLIYGWVFFGLVMLLLFWVGNFWQEKQLPIDVEKYAQTTNNRHYTSNVIIVVITTVVAFAANSWSNISSSGQNEKYVALTSAQSTNGWQLIQEKPTWTPHHLQTDYVLNDIYEKNDHKVAVYVAFYPSQVQDYEAVSYNNAIIGSLRRKQQERFLEPVELSSDGLPKKMNQAVVTQSTGSFQTKSTLVWQWYRIAGVNISSTYESKIYEVWARITQGRKDGAWISISTRISPENPEEGQALLKQFMIDMYPAVNRTVEKSTQLAK